MLEQKAVPILNRWLALGLASVLLVGGMAAWVRLAPSDPGRWHADPAAPGFTPGENWTVFCPAPDSRTYVETDDPVSLLARLDAIALATPHTRRLAGSPEDGRITWITRSALMGYPDYTTAAMLREQDGFRLCLFARQRFGLRDFGVNAARVGAWLQELLGLREPPDLSGGGHP